MEAKNEIYSENKRLALATEIFPWRRETIRGI
jgi:hypothetical protein